MIDDYGNVSSLADAGYVTAMHNRGIQVWALLDNFTNKEVSTANVVNNTTSRRNLIDQLIRTVQQYQIDGINVDFEAVKEVAGAITPVPGGVGLLTVAMLMENVVRAAEMQLQA